MSIDVDYIKEPNALLVVCETDVSFSASGNVVMCLSPNGKKAAMPLTKMLAAPSYHIVNF